MSPLRQITIAFALLAVARGDDPAEQFGREVLPILQKHCFDCHGPEKQKGGLRLDSRTAMLEGGDSEKAAIVPGKSGESKLIKFVTSADPDEQMPPKGGRLSGEQIAALKKWIDLGAHWQSNDSPNAPDVPAQAITDRDRAFWAFQPPRRSAPVPAGATKWVKQPIDAFVLAKLRERGLETSPEASPTVLIRRLTYDITGLPPTPEEADAFVKACESRNAASLDAELALLVDRLLASPRFGERMASLWLPLARFAEDQAHQVGDDTKFFHPNAHLYRAWVVGAFNRDLPYDQFCKLQLAADRLDAPADAAALGFLGLGPKYYNRNRIEVMADEWEDRVDVVTRTMLGLTVACARCHDHKFEPITQRDYYALAGIFASTRMVNKTPDGRVEKGDVKAEKMEPTTMHIVEEGDLKNLNIFIRGNVERKGRVAERGYIEVLAPGAPRVVSEGSGRRELAELIGSRDNPLTARVFVNRVWAALMGHPLVATPSNFGHSGSLPSHPALLDDLAVRFMESGWSVKALVREIAMSSTYRQRSGVTPADPANELLSHANRKRLSIEQWRDAVLAATGELRETIGGKSGNMDDPDVLVRTVYARVSRLKLSDLLMQFDYPDANVHAETRSVTTTPVQKLFLLNSAFMQRRAAAFARRIEGGAENDIGRVVLAYRLLFSREPDETERRMALDFLHRGSASDTPRIEQFVHALLASNEMLYLD